jgi:hypothetical protein
MEKNSLEKCYAIKFCAKSGQSSTYAYETIKKAFGNDYLPRAQLFRWQKYFENGKLLKMNRDMDALPLRE